MKNALMIAALAAVLAPLDAVVMLAALVVLAVLTNAIVAARVALSWQIGPDGKPLGADARHPGASAWDVHRLRTLRLVTPLIKRHL